MIRVISGEKGSGKTKILIDEVHKAVDEDKGSVVFVNKGGRYIHNLSFKVRFVDTEVFEQLNMDGIYGLICGITAQNFDISHIFVDSVTKIAEGNVSQIASMLDKVDKLAEKLNISITLTISVPKDQLEPHISKYLV